MLTVLPVEVVTNKEVATPLLFVFGDESDQLAVPLSDVGLASVTSRPLRALPFISVTVKVISVATPAPAAWDPIPVPEITMLPCPNVTVVLAVKVPAVARIVAIPPVVLVIVTSASPLEFTSADEALNVPRVVVNSTVPDTLPVTQLQ